MIDFLRSGHGISIFVVIVIILAIQFYVFFPWFSAIIKMVFGFFVKVWNGIAEQQSFKKSDWKATESTLRQIKIFENIFPRDCTGLSLNNPGKNVSGINNSHENDVLKVIIYSLNQYIEKNKGAVSDFHLMKDIVDRNCDAKEEEINAQIPVPLYLGLVGTMFGILLGVGFLISSGGLKNLLNSGDGNGADGIEALLGGVALAMLSSIVGIIFTTWGALSAKNAKVKVESNKNTFLSFLQAQLLPNLSSNVSSALVQMSRNLQTFNTTFSSNTSELGKALSQVNESYALQKQLLDSVQKIADKDIALHNLNLYNVLKNSTEEIGTLGTYLDNVNEYLANVRDLNKKLDNYENRTQFIENASKFYAKHENWLTENIETANRAMKDSVEKYNESVSLSLGKIQENLEIQMRNFGDIIEKQQEKLGDKTKEIDRIVDDLKKLPEVSDSISKFASATKEQNRKIGELATSIERLAQMKAYGVQTNHRTSIATKVAVIAGGSIVSLAGLSYLVPQIVKLISELIKLL